MSIVSEESAGMYTCTVTDSNSGQMDSANGTLDIGKVLETAHCMDAMLLLTIQYVEHLLSPRVLKYK